MYSSDFSEDVGPLVTEFNFEASENYELQGEVQAIGRKKKYDELWEGEYTYFTGTARFLQEVQVTGESPIFEGSISYQICSDETGQCIPYETAFRLDHTGKSLLKEGQQGSGSLFLSSMAGNEKDLGNMSSSFGIGNG